jgi:hypothetical protein
MKIKEKLDVVFAFRPWNVYNVKSKDGNYKMALRKSNDDATEDLNVYVIPSDSTNTTEYPTDKQLCFIDSDTGTIAFFDSQYPYIDGTVKLTGSEACHTDTLTNTSGLVFEPDGTILMKTDQNYMLAAKFEEGANVAQLQIVPKESEGMTVSEWQYEKVFDCRDLWNEQNIVQENSEINATTEQNVETLQKLLQAYLKRADTEITYRDNIIKGYENNWFINKYINEGRTPSSELIESRTFAKDVGTLDSTSNSSAGTVETTVANTESFRARNYFPQKYVSLMPNIGAKNTKVHEPFTRIKPANPRNVLPKFGHKK